MWLTYLTESHHSCRYSDVLSGHHLSHRPCLSTRQRVCAAPLKHAEIYQATSGKWNQCWILGEDRLDLLCLGDHHHHHFNSCFPGEPGLAGPSSDSPLTILDENLCG